MSDDMRLLILTHLRAAMERKDWRAVDQARRLAHENGWIATWSHIGQAQLKRDWMAIAGIYAVMGGVGAGAPTQSPGDPEKARDGVCGGVVVPADALKRARGSAAAPDGWMTLGNVR